jgi:hypothetical protein
VNRGLLAIYLNDHLAAATGARDLARRAARRNRQSAYGPFLEDLADQVDQDRSSLLGILGALKIRTDQVKVIGGWGAEKLGRLKLNGRLWGYSPLSRLIELEMLLVGVRGKRALWDALYQLAAELPALAPFELPELIARADRQLDALETRRLQAAAESFGSAVPLS